MGFHPTIRAGWSEALIANAFLILLYLILTVSVDDQFRLNSRILSARCYKMAVVFASQLWNQSFSVGRLTLIAIFNKL